MYILYISRNHKMGFSIGKVFEPIIEKMKSYGKVDYVEMPCEGYSPKSLIENIKYARQIAISKNYDIIHITGAEHYLLPFLRQNKTVITVHDLGFYTNQKHSLKNIAKYLLWIRTLKDADFVTFISEKSEKETLELVDLHYKKYAIVPNAVGEEYKYSPKRINTHYPIILHVGTKTNKNLERTAEALKGYPCKLRIVGNLTESQKFTLRSNNIDYENVSNLSNSEILHEYINCDFVNFPSLYEGFGMPIVEGQAIGRPVLTSNLSPMIEVAADAAAIVDPTKPKSIRNGYEKLKENPDKYIRLGLENVKRFKLDNVVKQYLEIYNKMLS